MMLLLAILMLIMFLFGAFLILGASTPFGAMLGVACWIIAAIFLVGATIVDSIQRATIKLAKAMQSPAAATPRSATTVHAAPQPATKAKKDAAWCKTCGKPGIETVEMGVTRFVCEKCGKTL
jgi:ribosomal protein L37AE/L43A